MIDNAFFSPLPNLVCLKSMKAVHWFVVDEWVYNWTDDGSREKMQIPICPYCHRSVIWQTEDKRSERFTRYHTVMAEDEFIEWKLTHEQL